MLAAWCNVACGGRVETDRQSTDSGTPPAGFYSVTWRTVTDSCQPSRPQGTFDELIGAKADVVNIVVSPTGHGRQDIRWDEPFFFTANDCSLALSLEVTSKSSHSFVVDSQVDWSDPDAGCAPYSLFNVPAAPCSVHQIATYELEEACPATRNGLHCL